MWLIRAKSALLMYFCQQGNGEENSEGEKNQSLHFDPDIVWNFFYPPLRAVFKLRSPFHHHREVARQKQQHLLN